MKTKSILLATLSICLITGSAFGQERAEVKTEVKSVKKEIRKEVRMEDEGGVRTLTISTDENGVKTEEIYTGDEADRKMAQIAPERGSSLDVEQRVEVKVDQANDKKVTITKTSNGKETIEVYQGDEAEAKLKELETETGTELGGGNKHIVVKKKEVKQSSGIRINKKNTVVK